MSEHQVPMPDGAVLYVRLLGQEHRERPLVIATHGGLGVESHTEAFNSFGFLAEQFRVIVYDMRGSGRSSDKGPFTHEQLVADLDELRHWAGADVVILAGASYGGFISLEYIAKHPQRVSSLLLRNTSASGVPLVLALYKALITSDRVQVDPDRLEKAFTGRINDRDELVDILSTMHVIWKPEFTASGDRRVYGPWGKMPRDNLHLETFNFSMIHNIPRYNVQSTLSNIKVPTLVVGGRQDVTTTVELVEEIATEIPGAELVILDGAGHNLPDDEPDLWRQTVWQFLRARGMLIEKIQD